MIILRLHKAYRSALFILISTFALSPTSVLAHAHIKQQLPTAESTITSSPTEISLTFSEGVELKFSHISLSTENTTLIETGPLTLDIQDNTRLITSLMAPLTAGKYNVSWSVVSIDGHKTKGNYSFSLKP